MGASGWALNLTAEPKPMPFRGALLLSTHPNAGEPLRADEGLVVNLALPSP